MPKLPKRRRAITLAGGGPAAGLHIGLLLRLDEVNANLKAQGEPEIEFEVWGLSCIGAWVGIVYNTFDDRRAERTYHFFRDNVFRDDASYEKFPINRAFGPDLDGFRKAWWDFVRDPQSYRNLALPAHIAAATVNSMLFWADPSRSMREGDRNAWFLNDVLAVNPAVRFLTSLAYLSSVNGLTKIYYPESSFLDAIKFFKLDKPGAPYIYHNAWDLRAHSIQLFANKPLSPKYRKISKESLCACSALPYIEQTLSFDGTEYCEGALVDTVNFKDLLEDHKYLDEVWVSRIVDVQQVEAPKNIADGLANLCMLFAAQLGDDDVKLFRQHVRKRRLRKPRVIDIPVASVHPKINFSWNHENLERGVEAGKNALDQALKRY